MAVRDIVQAAAGVSGEEPLFVESVFSTYLYNGNGSSQTITNGIALGDFGVGTSTEFDSTNSNLTKASDLTGNADGKTFTISVWIFKTENTTDYVYQSKGNTFQLAWIGGSLRLFADNGTTVLNTSYSTDYLPINTWLHYVASIDMSNTSNRYVYVNDANVTAATTWTTYSNQNIPFTGTSHYVGANSATGGFGGRIAHLYLDYTYRDLSVEANRRYFIDANGGSTAPSTLSALSPILYLPMTENYSVGENLGTGGDFTSNGSPTIVQSGTQYESGYGQGGLVWIKDRNDTYGHYLTDTERGTGTSLSTHNTNQAYSPSVAQPRDLYQFNSNGFSVATPYNSYVNVSSKTYASWTFRKAPKFFDVVTWQGTNGGGNKTISHSLNTKPACMIVRRYSGTDNWSVYHKDLFGGEIDSTGTGMYLNSTSSAFSMNNEILSVTDSDFTVSSTHNGSSSYYYVAYLFAHNAGGFGDDGEQNVISCGSFTTDGSGNASVNLGWEPQWVLTKRSSSTGDWWLMDVMRGMPIGSNNNYLLANTAGAEGSGGQSTKPSATGFTVTATNTNSTFIYIAIRRGPMKTPESGTEVYGQQLSAVLPTFSFPPDMVLELSRASDPTYGQWVSDRLRGNNVILKTFSTNAEESGGGFTAFNEGGKQTTWGNGWSSGYMVNGFRRAPGFFDVVCYTGTGSSGLVVNHNLGVAPELLIYKNRITGGTNWFVLDSNSNYGLLNNTNAFGSPLNISLGATSYTINTTGTSTNASGQTYVAYLFASVPGVSKVGTYTGTGTTQAIDCGFSAGARFILIKRTDSTGDWYVWDSARGIVSGIDPYLLLNSTASENAGTDHIDPSSAGFEISSSAPAAINASGGSYIYLAIA